MTVTPFFRECAPKPGLLYPWGMQSQATTVKQYLSELPEDRRAAISAVRRVMLDNLPEVATEGVSYGMIAMDESALSAPRAKPVKNAAKKKATTRKASPRPK